MTLRRTAKPVTASNLTRRASAGTLHADDLIPKHAARLAALDAFVAQLNVITKRFNTLAAHHHHKKGGKGGDGEE